MPTRILKTWVYILHIIISMFSLTRSEVWAVVYELKWLRCLHVIHLRGQVQRCRGRRGLELPFYWCMNRSPHFELPSRRGAHSRHFRGLLQDLPFLPHLSQSAPLTLLGSTYFQLLGLAVLSESIPVSCYKTIKGLSLCIYELLIGECLFGGL